MASSSIDGKPNDIQWETLFEKSIQNQEVLWVDRGSSWMDPIKAYLGDATLPFDEVDVKQVRKRAKWFILYNDILYRCLYARPLLRCVILKEGQKMPE